MRSTRTRVCMLIPGYYPDLDRSGGQLSCLLEKLDRNRVAPFVLTRRLPGTSKAQMTGATPVIRRTAPLSPGLFFLSALAYLWKRRREYDVIHVHSLDAVARAGAVIKRLLPGKKLIQRIPLLGPGSNCDRLARSRSGRRRLQFLFDKADVIVLPGPDTSGALSALGIPSSKIADIPDGIDTTSLTPPTVEEKRVLKRSFGIAENAFVAIVAGPLFARANVNGVLESWKKLLASNPNAVLIVAGGGPEGPRLARQADAEFEGRSVIFTGTATEEEIRRLYRTADVYVSYSTSETSSDETLEAMSSGLPVVAADTRGNKARVQHAKTGFLYDAKHPADGTDYLIRLAEDTSLLGDMSAAVRDETVNRYSFEQIARRMEGLYTGMPARSIPAPEKPAPSPEPPAVAPVEPPKTVVNEVPAPEPAPVVSIELAETVAAEVPAPEPVPVVPIEPPKPAAAAPSPEPPAVVPVEPVAEIPPPVVEREVPKPPPDAAEKPGKRRRRKKKRHKKKRDKAPV